MGLTKDEILKIAKLSMLEFKDSEINDFKNDLNDILEFVSKLDDANVENIAPLTQINEIINVYRDDVVRPSLSITEAIQNAPDSVDGTFIVPRAVSIT